MISIQNYNGNIIDLNHGNGTQPNKVFKIFRKHRVNYHILTFLLSVNSSKIQNAHDGSKFTPIIVLYVSIFTFQSAIFFNYE